MIGLRKIRNCQLCVAHQKFFPSILVIEENVHYMNMSAIEIFTYIRGSELPEWALTLSCRCLNYPFSYLESLSTSTPTG